MISFLTSHMLDRENGNKLFEKNSFADSLRKAVGGSTDVLLVCSDPDRHNYTDAHAAELFTELEKAGISLKSKAVLDGRNAEDAEKLMKNAGLVIFAGGHIPTQNAFFRRVDMKRLIHGYDGVLIGISAGTMNSARIMYSHPEREGEAASKDFVRFFDGLGLTEIEVIPHYQLIKGTTLDGMRLFEDVAYPDSFTHELHVFPDGTYIYIDGDHQEIRGEAYLIRDGVFEKISDDGETVRIK